VITDFVDSWGLFHDAYLAGWLLAALLSVLGVLVIARDQIFIGAAVSQASIVGIAAALRLGDLLGATDGSWARSDPFLSSMAVVGSALAALLTTRGGEAGGSTHEALTGWVFLLASSLSILLVAHSPHGLEEVHRLVSSSLIGATETDVATFALMGVVTAIGVAVTHRRLLLLAMDPTMAAAVGMRVGVWSGALSLWLGLLVGLSISVSGVLYTFGCLVLPPLVARNVCREVRPMFLVAPTVGVVVAAVGFVVAHHWDYPPAQMTVALLCLLLAISAPVRGLRRS
jgi:zinc/manganese transport system permease protein